MLRYAEKFLLNVKELSVEAARSRPGNGGKREQLYFLLRRIAPACEGPAVLQTSREGGGEEERTGRLRWLEGIFCMFPSDFVVSCSAEKLVPQNPLTFQSQPLVN